MSQCDFTNRRGYLVCKKCGWWVDAARVTLPLRKQCLGDKETKTSIRGAGDVVEMAAKYTGMTLLARMYKKVTGINCGCETRKWRWNKLLPFSRLKDPEANIKNHP